MKKKKRSGWHTKLGSREKHEHHVGVGKSNFEDVGGDPWRSQEGGWMTKPGSNVNLKYETPLSTEKLNVRHCRQKKTRGKLGGR